MNTSRRLAWASSLVVASALLGGCGDGEDDPDGSSGGDGGTTACAEDVDGADGRFCNGVETCEPESPAADARLASDAGPRGAGLSSGCGCVVASRAGSPLALPVLALALLGARQRRAT